VLLVCTKKFHLIGYTQMKSRRTYQPVNCLIMDDFVFCFLFACVFQFPIMHMLTFKK
uniref:Uncharacterized protein n=1 Tax=Sus scrofa TaxID=9823 RepID=A0A4X1TB38_PIG